MAKFKRSGPNKEPFPYIPKSVMQHASLATAPHSCFRYLAILVVGNAQEQNGRLMATDSYCAEFGMTSHDTVQRSRDILEERGLIVCTRRVQRMKRWPMLWAVTWWQIHHRDGAPVYPPLPAPHTYAKWEGSTATIGKQGASAPDFSSPRLSGDNTLTIGVKNGSDHPDLPSFSGNHHPDSRGHSRFWMGAPGSRAGSGSDSLSGSLERYSENRGVAKIEKLIRMQSHLTDADVAKITHEPIELVQRVRESMR